MHTAFVQVSLKEDHKIGSYEYMARVKRAHGARTAGAERLFPIRRPGGCGAESRPARADRRAGGRFEHGARLRHGARIWRAQIRAIPGVADVFIPQDIDYPALQLDVDRTRASELGLNQQEVVDNVITALTSNQMIAPSFWIDPKTGNDYMLTVQYPENQVKNLTDLQRHSAARARESSEPTRLDMHQHDPPHRIAHRSGSLPAAAHHRYLCAPAERRPGHASRTAIDSIIADTKVPEGLTVTLRGMVQGMRASFQQLRARAVSRGGAAVSDSGGAVPIVHRSVHHSARRAAGTDGRAC